MNQVLNGTDIKELRTQWGMSQQAFASELGVSIRWLWAVEKKNEVPGLLHQRAIRQLIRERGGLDCPKVAA
jgi:DNA-binding transcriptional regulator YiaG